MASFPCKGMLNFGILRARNLRTCSRLKLHTAQSKRRAAAESPTQQAQAADDIVIPDYIERSPTDILKALSSTVGRDLTASHFKFHDDPYLMPRSNPDKRQFALSQEAGRNAARWIRDHKPELFSHQTAQPFSQVRTRPVEVFDTDSAVSEETLLRLIDEVRVSDAVTVYRKLAAENAELSRETRQALLELFCYHNCDDTLAEDRIEERWFASTAVATKVRNTWKDNGVAEEVFRSLEPLDARAYNTLIRGMAKYHQADRAKKTWDEMLNQGFKPELETYNHMISIASFVMESSQKQWEFVEDLLRQMAADGVRPNTSTLTAVMHAVQMLGSWRNARETALAAWRELRAIGVRPSLASYYCLLSVFYRDRNNSAVSGSLLKSVLNELQGKSFTIEHPMDTYFFTTAMNICKNKLQDRDLALRVDELLHTGDNYDLIGDSYKEAIYYRNLLGLLSVTEPIEAFIENFYNKLVPNVYTPEPGIMEGLVKAVNLNGAVQYIPQLWTDMVTFGHTNRTSLLTTLLQTLALNPGQTDEQRSQLAAVGWDLFERVERQRSERHDKSDRLHWTAPMLGDLILVLTRAGEVSQAARILRKLDAEQTEVVGVPDVRAVQGLFDMALVHQKTPVCVLCARYACEMGFGEAQAMADTLLSTLPVTDDDRLKLASAGLEVPPPQS
ncbi:Protein PTCD3, mitochondrial [Amphibalanus amphitrite]|uniref:Small ribosomal subunit protein mS39 n=1 Tax=Amphibalanus amphitrite TaxID=1232801 RepID=A0A6A4VCT6_AMPAM|nr:Protein PTCD3, mitochondrial [Amphibalanus amphitrite]